MIMVMGVACGIGGDGLNDIINDEDKSDIVGDNNSHNGVNDDDSGVGGSSCGGGDNDGLVAVYFGAF